MTRIPIRRALLSVWDKTGLPELARALHEAGAELVSTGNTATAIEAAGLPVTRVEDLTGFPECLDGRVKTLHPRVHAGLLADTLNPDHNQQLNDLGIAPFQLLVSTLYPFEQTVAAGADHDAIIEKIDIGGPAMVRAAAKNHGSLAVITDITQYGEALKAIADGGFTLEQRRRLAAQAYAHTAAYDAAVSSWFAASYAPDEVAQETGWPDFIAQAWTRADALRYGENPHQRAALYKSAKCLGGLGGRPPGEQAQDHPERIQATLARPPWTLASPTPKSCTARPCRTTTTSTLTPPAGPRTTSRSLASRSSSTPTHAVSRSAPTSPPPTPRRWPATRSPRTAAWWRPTAR